MPEEEYIYLLYLCGVDIAIRYGLDGPGIESQWWSEIPCTRPDRSCEPTQSPVQSARGLSRG
jgi:hypothetical protein